jgi:uncharacterized membrane protein YkoI
MKPKTLRILWLFTLVALPFSISRASEPDGVEYHEYDGPNRGFVGGESNSDEDEDSLEEKVVSSVMILALRIAEEHVDGVAYRAETADRGSNHKIHLIGEGSEGFEVMVSSISGAVFEVYQERRDADYLRGLSQAAISLAKAIDIAESYAGGLAVVAHFVEVNNLIHYEVQVQKAADRFVLKVDAASGEIIERTQR